MGFERNQELLGDRSMVSVLDLEIETLGPTPVYLGRNEDRAQTRCRAKMQHRARCGRQPGDRSFDKVELVVTKQHRRDQQRLDIAEHESLAQLGRAIRRGEGHSDGTHPGDGQPGHDPVTRVCKDEPHPGALAQTSRNQLLGDPT